MLKSRFGALLGILAVALVAALVPPGVAAASSSRAEFMAQARAAGLTAAQATGLQAQIDDYLEKLDGRGTQVSPNQIDMNGAVLNVTVPGEEKPRRLTGTPTTQAHVCWPEYFCAYQYNNYGGNYIEMYKCWNYSIPWFTTGSWINNQTPGTRPRLYFTDGTSWLMPAAPSGQREGVYWGVVKSITNC